MNKFLKIILLSFIQLVLFVLLLLLFSYLYSLINEYTKSYQRGLFFRIYLIAFFLLSLIINLIYHYSNIKRRTFKGYLIVCSGIVVLFLFFNSSIAYMPMSGILVLSITTIVLLLPNMMNNKNKLFSFS